MVSQKNVSSDVIVRGMLENKRNVCEQKGMSECKGMSGECERVNGMSKVNSENIGNVRNVSENGECERVMGILLLECEPPAQVNKVRVTLCPFALHVTFHTFIN